jgi:hypothetical protein
MSANSESTPTASQVLRSLAASQEDTVSVGAVVSAVGSRAHGIALIVFALPDTVPLPIPSLSTVLGIPLVLIAAHLVLFGEDSGLPDRVLATAIPTPALRVGVRYLAPVLKAMELATRPRLTAIMRPARWPGLVCLYLAILLLLPLPLLNFPSAVCLVAIASPWCSATAY